MNRIFKYAVCTMLSALILVSVCCGICAEGAEIIFSGNNTAVPAWERFLTLSTPGNKKNSANHPIFDPTKIKNNSVFVITVAPGYDLGNQTRPADLVVGTNTDPQDEIDRQWMPVPVTSYANDTLVYTGKDIRETFGADMDEVLECIYVSSRVMNVTLLKVEFYADGLPAAQTEAVTETTTAASEMTVEETMAEAVTTTVPEEETTASEEESATDTEKTTVKEKKTEKISEETTPQTESEPSEPASEEKAEKNSGGQVFRVILVICAVFMAAVVFFIIKRARNKYY